MLVHPTLHVHTAIRGHGMANLCLLSACMHIVVALGRIEVHAQHNRAQ